ncbi:hypothetical protein [Halobaculum halobium]|uniref:hypothetical protein n=1 Tax=Halobaculum halobium TaxID=3032281 RepID=UPI0036F1BF50
MVENEGDDDGTFETSVYSNGTAMGENTAVEIPEQEQRRVSFTVRFDSPGVYAVKLNSTVVGNVTVQAANGTGNTTANATATETITATNGSTNTTVPPTPAPTATATQTDTPAATLTDSDTEETHVSEVQTGTTAGSAPGFGAASVVVSMSLLLGWLAYRRPDE